MSPLINRSQVPDLCNGLNKGKLGARFFVCFKNPFEMFMVMDSHLKETTKNSKSTDSLYEQHSTGALRQSGHNHASMHSSDVSGKKYTKMNIQFRQSFYLQTLLLCTCFADNVLDQSFF